MKKILSLILIVCFILCGCSSASTSSEREEVKINIPKDSTVNGYRVSSKTSSATEMPDVIKADDVGVINSQSIQTSFEKYCGNKNSKVFHRPDCTSISKTKEENRVYFKSREECVSSGYKPCGRCNP